MRLTNLKTVTKTVTAASVKLTAPADRIGLGFGAGHAYPADSLSLGHFPTPRNPEPEQLRSRQDKSAMQMRKQTHPDGTKVPDAVPPASSAGCLPPGSSAVRVSWRVTATDDRRSCLPTVSAVRNRLGSDCQSPDRFGGNHGLKREAVSAATARK
jgi:hypothetical protein